MISKRISLKTEYTSKKHYDVIVAGGGVAGVAAALSVAKRGRSVLLLEKSNLLGGLATMGLINWFVPMCNGRGKQIIFGMAEEWLRESALYGYDTIHDEWKNGEPQEPTSVRYTQKYSPYIFALQLTEKIKNAGVDILFDCIASVPAMDGNVCKGIITESKSGRNFYSASQIIDTTGDCDILRRSGMPCVSGQNFFTYSGKKITLESCKAAYESGNIERATTNVFGGNINLYGVNQPDNVPKWSGTTCEEVTDYLVTNQLLMLEKIKNEDRNSRDIVTLPMMPQFRTTCHIDGDYTLKESDAYKHFDDSVCAINDFDRRDYLYEVPLRALTRSGYPNLITAGRSVSAEGYAWDVVRVIPPAIITGQAAAEAAVLAIESKRAIYDVDIKALQKRLTEVNVLVHFPDELIPEDKKTELSDSEGHF